MEESLISTNINPPIYEETLTLVNDEPVNSKGFNVESYITLKPSAPQIDEEEQIYINDFLNNDNILALPFINIITKEIYDKSVELLKENYKFIKHIKNPTYEQWMIVYKKIYSFDGIREFNSKIEFINIFKVHNSHNHMFCKIFINEYISNIEYINTNAKTKELCDIVLDKILNNNYSPCSFLLQYIPEEFITMEYLKKIIISQKCFYHIPSKFKTEEFYKNAIDIDISLLKLITNQTEELCIYAINKNIDAIQYINQFENPNIVYNILKYAIDKDNNSIYLIKKYMSGIINCKKYYSICYANLLNDAVLKNGLFLQHITEDDIKIIGIDNYNKIKTNAINQTKDAKIYSIAINKYECVIS